MSNNLYFYGKIFDRFGTCVLKAEIDRQEFTRIRLRVMDGFDFDDISDEFPDVDRNVINSLVEQGGLDGLDLFASLLNGERVEVYVEEFVFGGGSTMDEAKLSYLNCIEANEECM